MNSNSATYPCSDEIGLWMLEGAREIIGQAGLNAVLNRAQSFHREYAQKAEEGACARDIQAALEELYGQRGGRGVALRSGRVSFDQLLRTEGQQMGLMELNYRMLPSPARIFMGLQLLAERFSGLTASAVTIEDAADAWQWHISAGQDASAAGGMQGICHFMIGFLQEYLMWASGGKYHHVEEVAYEPGDEQSCVIRLEKHSF